MENILNLKLPYLGIKINKVTDIPRVEYCNFHFCGSWLTISGKTELIDISWQNSKTGELISNEVFINRFFQL
jgi:hypothetical protein